MPPPAFLQEKVEIAKPKFEPPVQEEVKVEEVKKVEPEAQPPVQSDFMTPSPQQPLELIDVKSGPIMTDAEKKKLEELQKLKAARKLQKQQDKEKLNNDLGLPKLKVDALPEIRARKGQFEMIPDFLQQKKVKEDINNLNDMDMMANALNK